ncbi:hypothetical protein [Serratia marcescens]|uniref:hypothetical protein n=1 Tax=Serratia marcescens TaxID=615 RepID=UPI000950F669
MKPQPAIEPPSIEPARWRAWLDPLGDAARDWAASDGLIWLHLAKTVFAALLAMEDQRQRQFPDARIHDALS